MGTMVMLLVILGILVLHRMGGLYHVYYIIIIYIMIKSMNHNSLSCKQQIGLDVCHCVFGQCQYYTYLYAYCTKKESRDWKQGQL